MWPRVLRYERESTVFVSAEKGRGKKFTKVRHVQGDVTQVRLRAPQHKASSRMKETFRQGERNAGSERNPGCKKDTRYERDAGHDRDQWSGTNRLIDRDNKNKV